MLKVMDLLRLPSMGQSYIAAGGGGVFREVRMLECLEETYPSVVRFLTANEFYLTSLWSLANDKEGRIELIRAMIEHNCSGVGIMPGTYLNDKIDDEILKLANENSFPIIYIPQTARWGNIISEYGILASGYHPEMMNTHLADVLDVFSRFHLDGDPSSFCRRFSLLVKLPIIISTNTVYSYHTEGINVAVVISKVRNICQADRSLIQSPIIARIDNERTAVVYLGRSSMVIGCVANSSLREASMQLFHQVAPYALRELDKIDYRKDAEYVGVNLRNYADTRMYVVLIKGRGWFSYAGKLEKDYLIYERNSYQQHLLLLIPERDGSGKSIYQELQKIHSAVAPDLMVFSQIPYSQAVVVQEITHLKYMINSLSYLRGIFCVDELPILYLLTYAPREYDARLFSSLDFQEELQPETEPFLMTLRLYLLLHNISDVAKLQGIHVNSVKYRLTKALSYLDVDEDVPLNALPFTRLLMILERLIAENK